MPFHLLKKSQMQMMETVMILIVFFFILVIGLVFYANVQIGAAKDDLKKYNELKAIGNMQKLLFLPELQCVGGDEGFTCIDVLKLKALADVMANGTNRIYYSEELGKSLVVVNEVYPGNDSFVLYNNTVKGTASFIPVSLKYPIDGTYHMGLITIRTGG
jgi:hypothetical protein